MKLLLSLAVCLVAMTACEGTGPSPVTGTDQDCDVDAPSGRASRFRPEPRIQGRVALLDVVFPDGSRATLRYPKDLDLARAGVQPMMAGGENGKALSRPRLYLDRVQMAFDIDPVRCLRMNDGSKAGVWATKNGERYLVVSFPPWHVVVSDRNADLDLWATELRGRVTEEGWLILRGGGDLLVGPEARFGDTQLMIGSDLDPGLVIRPWRCQEDSVTPGEVAQRGGSGIGGEKFANWCDPRSDMSVHVYSQGQAFIERLAEGLSFEDVELSFPLRRYKIIP